MPNRSFRLGGREVGPDHPPLVIAEIGINHEGDPRKAERMIDDAAAAGAPVVKLQTHVIDDEMIPAARQVVPANADESIHTIMSRCALDADAEGALKARAEARGTTFLSTPFSRAAADRLEALGVEAYKIGSGEMNNLPLVDHVAAFGKPMIVSTGMNDLRSVARTVDVLERRSVDYALLHCTSTYPTAYRDVRLGALAQMAEAFPGVTLGLSDHSVGIYTCLGAIPLGARVLEKHFTSDATWPGPDVPISITPPELRELVRGAAAVFEALGGAKTVLAAEQPTIDFAYACVVTTAPVGRGERLTRGNTWVKRPGTGGILAADYERVLGRVARVDLPADAQLAWGDLVDADAA